MSIDLKALTALAGAVRERQDKHARPTATRKPWKINNLSATSAEVYIYDMIGDFGLEAQQFVAEFDAIQATEITVRFSSEGGEVWDGVAMYEAIARHPAHVTGIVDSLAASAASFILMACDVIKVAKTARIMIHDAGIGGLYVEGNAAQIRQSVVEILEFADLLDSMSDTIAQIYADRAGGTKEEWRAKMAKDKWYNATEAVEAGLADGIVGEEPKETPEEETTAWWDPKVFANNMKGVLG